MGRFRDSALDDDNESGIDISPLIDCVFILLIFFIVTTVFVEETGIEVDKPQAASASQLEKVAILIAIDDKGEVVYGNRNIGVGGVRATVQRIVQEEMVPVIIQADKNAPSGRLIRVMDEARLGGAEVVNVATQAGG